MLKGPDGCISNTQCSKILTAEIYFLPLSRLQKYGRLPYRPDDSLIVGINKIQYDESIVLFINHDWLVGYTIRGLSKRILDPHGEKYQLLVDAANLMLRNNACRMRECYIWLDFACMKDFAYSSVLDVVMALSDVMITLSSHSTIIKSR